VDVYPFEVFEGSIAVFEGSIAVFEGSIIQSLRAVLQSLRAVLPCLARFLLTFPPSLLRPLGAVERLALWNDNDMWRDNNILSSGS